MQTDFLVIGSGIAGLTYAIKVAEACPDKKILIVSKSPEEETNTKYAQGGIAVVNDPINDSFEKHIEDTLIAGDGLCRKDVVDLVVKEGHDRVHEIIQWGARFDKEKDGDFSLGREGGHSESRILHHKDLTGAEMERALLETIKRYSNIELVHHYFVVDLITQHHFGYLVTKSTPDITCYGVYALNLKTNQIDIIESVVTLLASGGNGQVYRTTTNPSIATGDGVAMVYRAKGRIENMEFIQFHPTAFYQPGMRGQAFLITEAVRGEGGILRNHNGEAFMIQYDARKDLAPRDIVARAIDHEMKKSGTEHVWLDCKAISPDKFKNHFPTIYVTCKNAGIELTHDLIPVAPAAHYSCGGVKTDIWGNTSIRGLYAAGECASTGLHGANRLASNSLLEAMVFAHRSFIDSIQQYDILNKLEHPPLPEWNACGTKAPGEMILITQSLKELQQVMSDYVGIVRNTIRLERAARRLDLLWEETEALYRQTELSPQLMELRNMITIGYLITKSASFRKESRGLHYNTDYPEKSVLLQDIVL